MEKNTGNVREFCQSGKVGTMILLLIAINEHGEIIFVTVSPRLFHWPMRFKAKTNCVESYINTYNI